MAKVKFSISFEIKEDQIAKFQNENEYPFGNLNGSTQQMLTAQVLGLQMLESSLNASALSAKDFKVKVDE